MSRYMITGGAGFIGSHLSHRLVESGEEVVVYDNLFSGSMSNLEDILDDITFHEADIRDAGSLSDSMKGCDYVVHLAAVASVPLSLERPMFTHEVNITGTLNVLLAARDTGVKRVVFASSSAVYGDRSPQSPKTETTPTKPLSPYGSQKLAGECYMRNFYDSYSLETVSLRFFNIFGPRQDPNSEYSAVISRFIKRLISGLKPIIYGDGKQSRDFTYVDDVIDAIILALSVESVKGDVFNIGRGKAVSLLDLIGALETITEKNIEVEFDPPRKGDIRHSWSDITLARQRLGYSPGVDLTDGLLRTFSYFTQVEKR